MKSNICRYCTCGYQWREGQDGSHSCSENLLKLVAEVTIENHRYKAALQRIAKWFDEFPSSGRTWDDGTEMSYGAAFGSNGERDYMRQIAADALSLSVKPK